MTEKKDVTINIINWDMKPFGEVRIFFKNIFQFLYLKLRSCKKELYHANSYCIRRLGLTD